MKKVLVVCGILAMLLCGCSKESVPLLVLADEVPSLPNTQKYQISVCLPDHMTEAVSSSTDDSRLFEAPDGSYFVMTQITSGQTAEETIRQMTGFDAKQLGAMKTKNMSLPEYRFSWCTEGENGMLTCTGIVVADEDFCYALQFCAREEAGKDCADARKQVLSSFSLSAG